MSNPYILYYENQVGSGIPGFRGLRNQKGYGFLSSFLTKSIFPVFKSIASSVNPTKIAQSALETIKGPGLSAGTQLADDLARLGGTATGSLLKSLQKGSGRKYKNVKHRRKRSVVKRRSQRKHKKVQRRKKRTTKSRHRSSVKQRKGKRKITGFGF